jgi:hypothetical protein
MRCCSEADCAMTNERQAGDHWEAQTPTGEWTAIPPEKILNRPDNPMGRPVLCWLPHRGVMCFIRPTES